MSGVTWLTLLLWAALVAVPSALFLLGYHMGRNHERKGWELWLDHKIPRLKGQRP